MFNPFKLLLGSGGSSRSIEASGRGRRLKSLEATRQHINQQIEAAGETITARARWLVVNDGYAESGLNQWVNACVGEGITLSPPEEVRPHWKKWSKNCDADGIYSFAGLQSLIASETFIAGECFIRRRKRKTRDMPGIAPFKIQVLPSEMLDVSYTQLLSNGNRIRSGIEFNKIGERVAYHFFRNHPGDVAGFGDLRGLRVRVLARDIIHVMDPIFAGQRRGISRFKNAIMPLFFLRAYDDAELERKIVAALFGGVITEEQGPANLNPDSEDEEEFDDFGQLEPGGLLKLRPGEKFETVSPADVGGSYEAFQYRALLRASASLRVPYAYVTKDTTRGNFSNVRTDLLSFRKEAKKWGRNVIIDQVTRRVYDWFLQAIYFADLEQLENYPSDPDAYEPTAFPPRQEWIDPAKDIKAEIDAIDAGLKTRTESAAESGRDINEIDEKRAEELANERDKKLRYSTSQSPVSTSENKPPAQEQSKEPEESEEDEQEPKRD
ncbi:phage portal protein [Pseudovibrio ascidiaceicola]|uniref:phage portal protein n=1 Tax=Pseudovibrio ascidiaceicola TaxID=285279 RepID=UPI003D361F09